MIVREDMSVDEEDLFFPKITLPPEVIDFIVEKYGQAKIILEYGSGGSTIIGAECDNVELLMSVESDVNWSAKLSHTIKTLYPSRNIVLHHVDIGPTKAWGYPKEIDANAHKFINFPQSVWDQDFFEEPDLILIDGRFRVGCFYTALLRITKPTTILWDDYGHRKEYHVVENYVKPSEFIGRMARFEVVPKMLPDDDLPEIMQAMILPQ